MTDRRSFLRQGTIGAGALWTLSLQDLMQEQRHGSPDIANPYGPVSPKIDDTTGLPLLQLPDGFRYISYGWTGDVMDDGVKTPGAHDGMAVVDQRGHSGKIVLVRNHEGGNGVPYLAKPEIIYAPDGAGGTTNITFDTRHGKWGKAWSSLAGTVRNCAGGVTPWGSWITCEETTGAGHGWNFEVDGRSGNPEPLKDMGRFSHEALMVDPHTGFVYETEDAGNAGFYKFVPNKYGRLDRGGDLYILKVKGQPNANLGGGFALGTKWDVQWERIDDPFATTKSVYQQGAEKGGARFSRLEGAWWGHRTGFFLSTDGGTVREGQVFEFDPREQTIKLIYESQNTETLDNPDNITVTPRGGLLLCEDGGSASAERLIGVSKHGRAFTFAVNNVVLSQNYNDEIEAGDYRGSELAGACYSPDGRWLFVNIQSPGITFAITGPWGHGPL
jgi:secreted PhoX family phosphatase